MPPSTFSQHLITTVKLHRKHELSVTADAAKTTAVTTLASNHLAVQHVILLAQFLTHASGTTAPATRSPDWKIIPVGTSSVFDEVVRLSGHSSSREKEYNESENERALEHFGSCGKGRASFWIRYRMLGC